MKYRIVMTVFSCDVIMRHRWFANKSCPGNWLYARLGDLASEVTAKLGGGNDGTTELGQKNYYRVRKTWEDAASQLGAYTVLENARQMADKHPGYSVFDWNGKAVYKAGGSAGAGSGMTNADCPFMVRVSVPDLNIRVGAGTDTAKTGKYTGVGCFTITEVLVGKGSTKGWGRLKSGEGFISLDYCQKLLNIEFGSCLWCNAAGSFSVRGGGLMGMIMEKNAYGISAAELEKMKNVDIRNVDPEELEDIANVKIHGELPDRERILDYIGQVKNPYCYRSHGVVVKIGFAGESRLEDWACFYDMHEDVFMEKKKQLTEKLDALIQKKDAIQKEHILQNGAYQDVKEITDLADSFLGEESLTRKMVETFIKQIYVYDEDHIEIIYNFEDDIRKILDRYQADKEPLGAEA